MTTKNLTEAHAIFSVPSTRNATTKRIINEAIAEAASIDGDRVLDGFEATILNGIYDDVVGGGRLTKKRATAVRDAMAEAAAGIRANRAPTTEAIFTSEGKALTKFRAKILGAITDTIEKADGNPVDINMMLFAFTDKKLSDALVDLAKEHPNATFRLLTDWSQLSTSGSRQPPRLARVAKSEGLENLQVKFKRDNPYVWSEEKERPVFSHRGTKGLNHHKGFVTLIDGKPEKMVFGSFNWSLGAMKRNYENLMILDRADAANRRVMGGYDNEFAAFWNNDEVALSFDEARAEKNRVYKELYEANGADYNPMRISANAVSLPDYTPRRDAVGTDINSFGDADYNQLVDLAGGELAEAISSELQEYGRFGSWTELLVRVPQLADADHWVREQLQSNIEYGLGKLAVSDASANELVRAGFSTEEAEAIVEFRATHGAFESLDELNAIEDLDSDTLAAVSANLTDDQALGAYSGRVPGGPTRLGYADTHASHWNIPSRGADWPGDLNEDGILDNRETLEPVVGNLAAPVADMLRRTPAGETFRLAIYGMSDSSPEYKELKAAAKRGVKVRVVIYGKYNGKAINALNYLKRDGYDVDFRVIKSRVMHEKFGVVGDDVFNGSSNWSSSSIKKHSEDRFLFRNMPNLADRFVEEFARLWDRGNPA